MGSKIQLTHPEGKKAINIDAEKYEVMSKAILRCLKGHTLTHKEMFEAINADLKKNKIKFDGSVEWYMEWVKLDLEAKKMIKRVTDDSKLKFQLK